MGKFGDAVDEINEKVGEDEFGLPVFPDWTSRIGKPWPSIPTGVLVFDALSGVGGLPRGIMTELFGPESCGKSTLLLEAGRECQQTCQQGVLWLDYAHCFDPTYAVNLGMSLDKNWFALYQPSTLEDGMRVAEAMMDKSGGELGMVVVDDVASMNPAQDKEKEVGEVVIGSVSRAIGNSLRQLTAKIAGSQTVWAFINQVRDVIDTGWSPNKAKAPKKTTSPGGRAVKHYAGMRVEFSPRSVEREKMDTLLGADQRVMIGQKSWITFVKNKVSRPYRSGEVYLRPGEGFDSITTCLEVAEKLGLFRVNKGTYTLPKPFCSDDLMEQTIRGFANAREYFSSNPEKLALLVTPVEQALRDAVDTL